MYQYIIGYILEKQVQYKKMLRKKFKEKGTALLKNSPVGVGIKSRHFF